MSERSKADLNAFAIGAGVAVSARLVGRGLHVLSQLIMARLLGPGSFGLFTIGWTLLGTVGLTTPLGLDRAVIRFGAGEVRNDPAKLKGLVTQAFALSLGAGSVVAAALYFYAVPLAVDVFHKPGLAPILAAIAPAFLLSTGLKVAGATTRITKRMGPSAAIEFFGQPAVLLLIVVFFASNGLSATESITAVCLSMGGGFLAALLAIRSLLPSLSSRVPAARYKWSTLLAFSLPAALGGSLQLFTTRADRLVIALFATEAEVGIYQAASQSALLFGIILSGLTAILQPMIADLHQAGNLVALNRLFSTATRWALLLSLPLFLVMLLATDHVVVGLYGVEYQAASAFLSILILGQLVNAGTGSVGPMLVMTGNQNVLAVLAGTALVLTVTLDLWLVPIFGVAAAAWVQVGARTLVYSAGLIFARRLIGVWPYDRSFFKAVLPTLAAAPVVWLAARSVPQSFLGLVLLCGLSVTVFGGVLWKQGLDDDESAMVNAAMGRLRRKSTRD